MHIFASFPNASSSWFLSLPQREAADSLPNSPLNACKEEQLSLEEPGSLQDFQEKDLPSPNVKPSEFMTSNGTLVRIPKLGGLVFLHNTTGEKERKSRKKAGSEWSGILLETQNTPSAEQLLWS